MSKYIYIIVIQRIEIVLGPKILKALISTKSYAKFLIRH